jgi:hypothetical protein
VWIYTQSNITQASYSPEYITPTQQISRVVKFDMECRKQAVYDRAWDDHTFARGGKWLFFSNDHYTISRERGSIEIALDIFNIGGLL